MRARRQGRSSDDVREASVGADVREAGVAICVTLEPGGSPRSQSRPFGPTFAPTESTLDEAGLVAAAGQRVEHLLDLLRAPHLQHEIHPGRTH